MFDFSTAKRRRQTDTFRRYRADDAYSDAEMQHTFAPDDPVALAGGFRCKAKVAYGMARSGLVTLDRNTGRFRRSNRFKVDEVRRAVSLFMAAEQREPSTKAAGSE